jgi:rhodanese-related sulfurtransferase
MASCVLLVLTSLIQAAIVSALPYTDIDVDTAHQMITSGAYPNLVVLDVRTLEEFDTGHIRKALLIPHTELEHRIEELAEHKHHEIIVYCLRGSRSAIACGILDTHEFTKVYNMLGGIEAWIGKGYPTTTSYLTEIFFNITPNPATAGQTITIKGILTDQFSSPLANDTVKLYYRARSTKWHFASSFTTNDYGIFVTSGKPQKLGIYQLCVYYPGCAVYELSYKCAVLIVQP